MQETPHAMPHWVFQILQWLAAFGAGGLIVKLIMLYQNRKRPKAEIEKTEAETTEIIIRSSTSASDAVIRMMNKLDETLICLDRARSERDALKQELNQKTLDLDLSEIRNKHHEEQEGRMLAIMKLHGYKYKEFDERPRSNKEP